ncbi:lipocalin family protein [Tabrizicola sp. J26]|uniref:lipocalin family protein n=1 Tax=Alitabrizicola rongguiensis TaxID=2909234 RepID=UPI001F470422|nr:lipocalin family protein [Tabrizicola rongguiensis]MCF1708645.1 lipocalin family protein [Tabrizicola rongguiensis]
MKLTVAVLTLALTATTACAPFWPSNRWAGKPMFTVSNLQPGQLAGTWYQVASFPQEFQRGCGLTTATYTPREDGTVGVLNQCEVKGQPGHVWQIAGTARLVGPGQFKVRLDGVPVPAGYWVLDISRDGRTIIVGNPNRLGGWVLSRDRSFSPQQWDRAVEVFARNGYDVAALQRSPLK